MYLDWVPNSSNVDV